MEVRKKKIKVLNRGMILTSRGMVRGPILQPYYETVESIILMISRFDAQVVEILSDGTEVALDITNADRDNSINMKDVIPTVVQKTIEPEEDKIQKIVENPDQAINKNMSRKERKRLEYERERAAREAAKAAAEQVKEEVKEDTNSVSEEVKESQGEVTEVSEDIITE